MDKNKILKLLRSTLKSKYRNKYNSDLPSVMVKKAKSYYKTRVSPQSVFYFYIKKKKPYKFGPSKYILKLHYGESVLVLTANNFSLENSAGEIIWSSTELNRDEIFNLTLQYNVKFDLEMIQYLTEEMKNKKYHNKETHIYFEYMEIYDA